MTLTQILAIFLVCLIVYIFLIAPGRLSLKLKRSLRRARFASRGVFDLGQGVPENSRPAFLRAVKEKKPIIMEVRLTSDDECVIVSDSVLLRICDVQRRVEHLPLEMVVQQRAFHTNERILSLGDALECVAGRVPILLHVICDAGAEDDIADAIISRLKGYAGAYMVASFNTKLLRLFRSRAPRVMRGHFFREYSFMHKYMSALKAFALTRMLTNFISRPQFILRPDDARGNASAWICEKLMRMPVIRCPGEDDSDA